MIRWPVYKGRLRVAWALIDEADVELVEPYLWRLHSGYPWVYTDENAYRGMGMHRLLCELACSDPREVDHINGDPLDNRRANLRVCTRALNGQNMPSRLGTSRFRGVHWNTARSKWIAQGKVHGKTHYLGIFDSEHEAAQVAAAWRGENLPFTNVARDVLPDLSERATIKEVM